MVPVSLMADEAGWWEVEAGIGVVVVVYDGRRGEGVNRIAQA